ncbi:hypothetical protein EZS27_020597, partial [termite gut metagenome]
GREGYERKCFFVSVRTKKIVADSPTPDLTPLNLLNPKTGGTP